MAELSSVMKDRIAEALDATRLKQRALEVRYDGATDALATVTRFEYRFVIGSAGDGFTTSEYPGINSDQAETIQRSDFEACIRAIRDWAERVLDREEADILDQFGGVADRNPSLSSS